jgi:hypothetical protein
MHEYYLQTRMNQSRRKFPFTLLLLLLCLGAGAVVFAFWLIDHNAAILSSGVMIAVSMGVFFASYTGALLLYIRWRAVRATVNTDRVTTITPSRPDLGGTIYGLIPGSQYQVTKSFTDYYGNTFGQGEILRFKERHFLPYDGGHTIVFHERSLYLQEEKNQEIVDHFSEYIVLLTS